MNRPAILRRMAQAAREARAYRHARGILPRSRTEPGFRLALARLARATNAMRELHARTILPPECYYVADDARAFVAYVVAHGGTATVLSYMGGTYCVGARVSARLRAAELATNDATGRRLAMLAIPGDRTCAMRYLETTDQFRARLFLGRPLAGA